MKLNSLFNFWKEKERYHKVIKPVDKSVAKVFTDHLGDSNLTSCAQSPPLLKVRNKRCLRIISDEISKLR